MRLIQFARPPRARKHHDVHRHQESRLAPTTARPACPRTRTAPSSVRERPTRPTQPAPPRRRNASTEPAPQRSATTARRYHGVQGLTKGVSAQGHQQGQDFAPAPDWSHWPPVTDSIVATTAASATPYGIHLEPLHTTATTATTEPQRQAHRHAAQTNEQDQRFQSNRAGRKSSRSSSRTTPSHSATKRRSLTPTGKRHRNAQRY